MFCLFFVWHDLTDSESYISRFMFWFSLISQIIMKPPTTSYSPYHRKQCEPFSDSMIKAIYTLNVACFDLIWFDLVPHSNRIECTNEIFYRQLIFGYKLFITRFINKYSNAKIHVFVYFKLEMLEYPWIIQHAWKHQEIVILMNFYSYIAINCFIGCRKQI